MEAEKKMIVNVSATHTAIVTSQLSRHDLLLWVNTTLKADFTKVDELCTGAAYCQLMHSLYPKMVPIKRVKYCTNIEHEFIDNFKILQTVFQKLQVQKAIPIDRLVRGKFQDNIEFLQWFKKFYDANYDKKSYDPVGVRNGQPMGYGSAGMKKKSKGYLSPRSCFQPEQHSYREESSLNTVDNNEPYVFKRSLTRTELRHDLSMSQNLVEIPAKVDTPRQVEDKPDDMVIDCEQSNQQPEELPAEINMTPTYFAHACLKLERILTYCLEAKAAGQSTVDVTKVKHIIYSDPYSTDNDFDNVAEVGAGDHVKIEDIVDEN